jgi:hypothetical protein
MSNKILKKKAYRGKIKASKFFTEAYLDSKD